MQPIQQSIRENIQKAFTAKQWDQVIVQSEVLLDLVHTMLMKQEGVSDYFAIPAQVAFPYLADHELGPVLLMKGAATLASGDPGLAGQFFADAILSSHNNTTIATAYLIDAILRIGMEDDNASAHNSLMQAKGHDLNIISQLDSIYNTYLDPTGAGLFAAQKEELKKQLELL